MKTALFFMWRPIRPRLIFQERHNTDYAKRHILTKKDACLEFYKFK